MQTQTTYRRADGQMNGWTGRQTETRSVRREGECLQKRQIVRRAIGPIGRRIRPVRLGCIDLSSEWEDSIAETRCRGVRRTTEGAKRTPSVLSTGARAQSGRQWATGRRSNRAECSMSSLVEGSGVEARRQEVEGGREVGLQITNDRPARLSGCRVPRSDARRHASDDRRCQRRRVNGRVTGMAMSPDGPHDGQPLESLDRVPPTLSEGAEPPGEQDALCWCV
ncbi:unnamed protein product [Protopolystoma xenopodis]|uniref:Uncharacterized protein n=1 Tax=Protopolystoma xenopodis TaxID=117903 RepID=A0A3S5FDI5_9PLAT|nr:unnamed protein product [Protopolystoma xenopodis]